MSHVLPPVMTQGEAGDTGLAVARAFARRSASVYENDALPRDERAAIGPVASSLPLDESTAVGPLSSSLPVDSDDIDWDPSDVALRGAQNRAGSPPHTQALSRVRIEQAVIPMQSEQMTLGDVWAAQARRQATPVSESVSDDERPRVTGAALAAAVLGLRRS